MSSAGIGVLTKRSSSSRRHWEITFRASSIGTLVKRLTTSKLTRMSSSSNSMLRTLFTNSVELFTKLLVFPGGPECELVPWPVCMSETRWLKRWVGVGCPPCGSWEVRMILCYVYTQITISISIFFHYTLGRVYWTVLCCNHYLVLLLFALQLCLYLVTFHFSTFTRIISDY